MSAVGGTSPIATNVHHTGVGGSATVTLTFGIAWNLMRLQQVMCYNKPGDGKLPSTIKVTERSGIYTSKPFGDMLNTFDYFR